MLNTPHSNPDWYGHVTWCVCTSVDTIVLSKMFLEFFWKWKKTRVSVNSILCQICTIKSTEWNTAQNSLLTTEWGLYICLLYKCLIKLWLVLTSHSLLKKNYMNQYSLYMPLNENEIDPYLKELLLELKSELYVTIWSKLDCRINSVKQQRLISTHKKLFFIWWDYLLWTLYIV